MDRTLFEALERYMISCAGPDDSAHDPQHIYRVLYTALALAEGDPKVDREILTAACLLHDIGRPEEYADPLVCHAQAGGEKAYTLLRQLGWSEERAGWVRDCIAAHRYRSDKPSVSREAKLLFDADKLDVSGALGIARTLLYEGKMGEPLYRLGADKMPCDGREEEAPSFFREYCYKLENLPDRLYTRQARELARERQEAARAFYASLLGELQGIHRQGQALVEELLG